MSSDAVIRSGLSAQGSTLARTVVPAGITDPVEQARAELKAALAAIEQRANLPRRFAEKYERAASRARAFTETNPIATAAMTVVAAAGVGAAVWAAIRAYVR